MIASMVDTKNGEVKALVRGSTMDILVDATMLIHEIYKSMAKHDEEGAKFFADTIKKAAKDGFMFTKSDEDMLHAVEKYSKDRMREMIVKAFKEFTEDESKRK